VAYGAGKIRYTQLLEFPRKGIRDAFSQRVIEAVVRFEPHALEREAERQGLGGVFR
jgi:hypothetical protein